jgi:hypothetical protein
MFDTSTEVGSSGENAITFVVLGRFPQKYPRKLRTSQARRLGTSDWHTEHEKYVKQGQKYSENLLDVGSACIVRLCYTLVFWVIRTDFGQCLVAWQTATPHDTGLDA